MAKKILIVEDDKMLLTIFQMFVQELGYEVAGIARTGQEALEAASRISGLACVLMDIQLDGDMDGIATARSMIGNVGAPVIFATGINDKEVLKNGVLENVYGFMIKPLYKQSLGMTIEFACAKYKMDRSK